MMGETPAWALRISEGEQVMMSYEEWAGRAYEAGEDRLELESLAESYDPEETFFGQDPKQCEICGIPVEGWCPPEED